MLSRIKLDLEEIKRALLDVDDGKLTPDDLRAISRQLPTPEEVGGVIFSAINVQNTLQVTRIRDFEDVGKLAKSDQYFSQVRETSTPNV
jgi:diaphanous 1